MSVLKELAKKEAAVANDFIKFIRGCPSQFHAVEQAKKLLKDGGFEQISERESNDWTWSSKTLHPNGKYFFTRNQSTLVAFAVGGKYKSGAGFNIAAAHTDSPVLKVKPVSNIVKSGYIQVGVETYGGGLFHTWFDRDLSLAGRVIVKDDKDKDSYTSKLVCIDKPILRIPNLAIHLDREVSEKGFNPNRENHLLPILCSTIKNDLNQQVGVEASDKEEQKEATSAKKQKLDKPKESPKAEAEHSSVLMKILAEELKVNESDIRDFELCVYDTQPATIGGAMNEFIIARGLDNLMMCFVSLRALLESSEAKSLAGEEQIRMIALFDNEEVGSQSCMGAASSLVNQVLQRLNADSTTYDSAIRKSFLMSCDMAHGLHPNYADKHEANHRPMLHKGLVIKQNANQRYASNSISIFLLCEIAKKHGLPVQKFCVRNDSACGTTIGPILAANVGMRTVDVGIPQWSMHSIRETCGTGDVVSSIELIKKVFEEFSSLDQSLASGDAVEK